MQPWLDKHRSPSVNHRKHNNRFATSVTSSLSFGCVKHCISYSVVPSYPLFQLYVGEQGRQAYGQYQGNY